MTYTVTQLSRLAGVSVRTLHYYDEIGLLKPSFIKGNGYRSYEEKELVKLQQILFFKELEFPLPEIIRIMQSNDYDMLDGLSEQRKLLVLKANRLQQLLLTLDKTIAKVKGGESMTSDDMFGSFTKDEMEAYKKEAGERWGKTDAYKQSVDRTKDWKKTDYDRVAKKSADLTQKIASAKEKGFTPDSPEVQSLIGQHYNGLRTFYEPNYELYKGLAQMYVDDPRFSATYEKFATGLAVFMRDAMVYYAETNS